MILRHYKGFRRLRWKEIITILIFLWSFGIYSGNILAQEKGQGIGGLISPGKLSNAHSDIEGINNCTKCHQLGGGVPDSKCLDCHNKIRERIEKGKGLHANAEGKCFKCHTDHKGKHFSIVEIDKDKFEHEKTGYKLEGKHYDIKSKCSKCHGTKGSYLGLNQECTSCHKNRHADQFGSKKCLECHDVKAWKPAIYNHFEKPKFKLTGKHKDVECAKCHRDDKFKGTTTVCSDCHKNEHKDQFLGRKCDECHKSEGWKPSKYDHEKNKKFKLTGKHKDILCAKCHRKGLYQNIGAECIDCHKNLHKEQFADLKCTECHKTKEWKPSTYKHEKNLNFKLTGKHKDVKCALCHEKGKFRDRERACTSCHKDEHKKQFAEKKCDECHKTEGWKPSTYKHEDNQKFKLTGKHKDVLCSKCHEKKVFRDLERTCASCHKDKHEGQFKKRICEDCHKTEGWSPSTYDHSKNMRFKLSDKHKDIKCSICHSDGKFAGLDTSCGACHKPNHKVERPKECERCHTVKTWKLDPTIHAKRGFPLIGGHAKLGCSDCHKDAAYKQPAVSCATCHKDIHYNQFGMFCKDCHSPVKWKPSTFTHAKAGYFGLGGVHRLIADCSKCHSSGQYKNLSLECYNCHKKNYEGTTMPPHKEYSSIFTTECNKCHKDTDTSFRGIRFDHSFWPLEGRHSTAPCSQCHGR
ncbi:MAG: hypothetical protein AABY58_00395 [Nitrospirota bacterium]